MERAYYISFFIAALLLIPYHIIVVLSHYYRSWSRDLNQRYEPVEVNSLLFGCEIDGSNICIHYCPRCGHRQCLRLLQTKWVQKNAQCECMIIKNKRCGFFFSCNFDLFWNYYNGSWVNGDLFERERGTRDILFFVKKTIYFLKSLQRTDNQMRTCQLGHPRHPSISSKTINSFCTSHQHTCETRSKCIWLSKSRLRWKEWTWVIWTQFRVRATTTTWLLFLFYFF